MADLVLTSVWLSDVHAPFRLTLPAHEAITAGAPCYENSDGEAAMCASDVDGFTAAFDGVAILATSEAQPVTLFQLGSIIHFVGQSFVIGSFIYPSDTPGALSDAAVSTGEMPIMKAISATDAIVVRFDSALIDNS